MVPHAIEAEATYRPPDETPSAFMEAVVAETTWTCRACDFGTYYDESIPPEPFPCWCCDGLGVHWPGERCRVPEHP